VKPRFNPDCKSFRIFENALNNPKTLKTYIKGLDHFMRFHKFSDYDKIVKMDTDAIDDHLEAWMISQKKAGLKKSTIVCRLNAVELLLDMNKKIWHRKIVRKLLPQDDVTLGGSVPFTTDELYRMKLACKKPRDFALLEFLGSTGVRPGAVEDPILRIKHLVDMPHPRHVHSMPRWCYAIKVYDESRDGYWAFLYPPARKCIDSYLSSRRRNGEEITPESPLFLNYENEPKTKQAHMSVYSVRRTLGKLMKAAEIQRTKVGARYDKAIVYGFRKRFNGILKMNNNINSNIAEKLMAHKNGLDGTYLKPTREECYTEFVKAVKDLTLDPTERQKIQIEDLAEQNSKFELLLKDSVATLSDKVMKQEQEIKELKLQRKVSISSWNRD